MYTLGGIVVGSQNSQFILFSLTFLKNEHSGNSSGKNQASPEFACIAAASMRGRGSFNACLTSCDCYAINIKIGIQIIIFKKSKLNVIETFIEYH